MDSIVLLYNKELDKVVKGKVTYYEDWFDKWKRGEKGEILSIEFENGETPFGLEKKDIQKVYDQVDEKFKEKMGINYEEFCEGGAPSYKEVLKKIEGKKLEQNRGLRAKSGVIDDFASKDDIEKLKEEVKKAEEKLAKLKKRKEFLKMEEELRKNGKIKLDKLLGEIKDEEKVADVAEKMSKIAEEYVVDKETLREAIEKIK